jgi:formate dehydrogenase iron-sulfur subunit
MPKAFFIDTSRCTACRGCQLACKEWNELPANSTKQRGSHQNPPDLNANNYKLVRFNEHLEGTTIRWNFFPDQCRHCLEPPCGHEAAKLVDEAIIRDQDTGAVIYTDKTKEISADGFEDIRAVCPYDIPRRDSASGRIVKCTMCNERVVRGMLPACVKACPTGTMNFGDRQKMLDLAQQRLAVVRKEYPKALLADPDDVNVIYLLIDAPKNYHKHSVAQRNQEMDRKVFLARLARPLSRSMNALLKL